MPHTAFDEDRHIGRAAADVGQHHAHLFLVLRQHRFARRDRIEHQSIHADVAAFHALHQVMNRRGLPGHDMRFHFQPEADHAHRLFDAVLPVHRKAARNDVQHFAVLRNGNRARRIQRPAHIVGGDAAIAAIDAHHAARIDRRHVAARHADEGPRDLIPARSLGLLDRGLDGRRGVHHIDHHALLNAARRRDAHPDDLQLVLGGFTDHGAHLGGSDINADNGSFHNLPHTCSMINDQ